MFFNHQDSHHRRAFFTLDAERSPTEFTDKNADLVRLFLGSEFELIEGDSLQSLPKKLKADPAKYALIIVYVPSEESLRQHRRDLLALTHKINFLIISDHGAAEDLLEAQVAMITTAAISSSQLLEGHVLVTLFEVMCAVSNGGGGSPSIVPIKVKDAISKSAGRLLFRGGKKDRASDMMNATIVKHFCNESLKWTVLVSASPRDGQVTSDASGPGYALTVLLPNCTVNISSDAQSIHQQELRLELAEDVLGMEASLCEAVSGAIGMRRADGDVTATSLGEGVYSLIVPKSAVGPALKALAPDRREVTLPAEVVLSFVSLCYSFDVSGTRDKMLKCENCLRLCEVHGELEVRIEDVSFAVPPSDNPLKPPLSPSTSQPVSRTASTAVSEQHRQHPPPQPNVQRHPSGISDAFAGGREVGLHQSAEAISRSSTSERGGAMRDLNPSGLGAFSEAARPAPGPAPLVSPALIDGSGYDGGLGAGRRVPSSQHHQYVDPLHAEYHVVEGLTSGTPSNASRQSHNAAVYPPSGAREYFVTGSGNMGDGGGVWRTISAVSSSSNAAANVPIASGSLPAPLEATVAPHAHPNPRGGNSAVVVPPLPLRSLHAPFQVTADVGRGGSVASGSNTRQPTVADNDNATPFLTVVNEMIKDALAAFESKQRQQEPPSITVEEVDRRIQAALAEKDRMHRQELDALTRELANALTAHRDVTGHDIERVRQLVTSTTMPFEELQRRVQVLETSTKRTPSMLLSPPPPPAVGPIVTADTLNVRLEELKADVMAMQASTVPAALPPQDLSHLMPRAVCERLIEDLTAQIPTQRQVIGLLKGELANAGLHDVQQRISDVERAFADHSSQFTAVNSTTLTNVQGIVETCQTRIAALELQIRRCVEQHLSGEHNIQDCSRKVDRLQADVGSSVETIRDNEEVLKNLQLKVRGFATIDEVRREVASAAAQLSSQLPPPTNSTVEQRVHAVVAEVESLRTTLESRTEILRAACGSLEEKLSQAQSKITELQVAATKQLEALRHEVEEGGLRQRRLASSIEALQEAQRSSALASNSTTSRSELHDTVQGVVLPQMEPVKMRLVQLEGDLRALNGSLDGRYAQRDRTEDVLREQRRATDDSIEKVVQSFSQRLFVVETRLDTNVKRLVEECREICKEEIALSEQRSEVRIAASSSSPYRDGGYPSLPANSSSFSRGGAALIGGGVDGGEGRLISNSGAHTPSRQVVAKHSSSPSALLSPRYEEVEVIKSFCNRNASDVKELKARVRQLETAHAGVSQLLAGEDEHLRALESLETRLIKLENRR